MLDSKAKNQIKNGIRKAFRYSAMHKHILHKSRVEKIEGKLKNGKDKVRIYYQCNHCKELFKAPEIEVDHIDAVGKFTGDWNQYIDRVFCHELNLQCLCKPCHVAKK